MPTYGVNGERFRPLSLGADELVGAVALSHVRTAEQVPDPAALQESGPEADFLGYLFDPADELDWQERAICGQTDPEAFFPEKGGSTREAKRICLGCEVRSECLEYALEHNERFGIWGGLSERERRRLQKRST